MSVPGGTNGKARGAVLYSGWKSWYDDIGLNALRFPLITDSTFAMSRQSPDSPCHVAGRSVFGCPFVSVVVPCHNHGRYLARAVDSALAQKEVAEVVVIEDGGEDGADAICREYEKRYPERFRWVRHEPGQAIGAGRSRNEGIRLARYDWIAFLDADDRYLPGRFAEDVRVLAADPTLDGVYDALGAEILRDDAPAPEDVPEAPASRRIGIAPGMLTTLRRRYSPEALLAHLNPIGMDGSFSTDTILLHRRVFEKTGTSFGKRKVGEDTLFWLQLASVCRLASAAIDRPVAMRGIHEATRGRILRTSRESAREVLDEFLAWGRDRGLPASILLTTERTRLHFCTDWAAIGHVFRRRPRLLFDSKAWGALIRWTLFRQFPDDPVLPGFFPSIRRKNLS